MPVPFRSLSLSKGHAARASLRGCGVLPPRPARAALSGLAALVVVLAGCTSPRSRRRNDDGEPSTSTSAAQPAFEDEGLGVSDLSSRVGAGSPASAADDDPDGWTIVAACRMPSGVMSLGVVPEDAVTSAVRRRALDGGYQAALDLCQ